MSSHPVNASRTTEAGGQNGTDRDDYITKVLCCVSIPVGLLGLLGNGAVVWILCCRIKRTKYTVYVLNLAIADLTVLFCNITFSLLSLMIWKTFAFEDFLYLVLDILWFFGYNSSIFLLTAISVERCLGIFYPFWYLFNRSEHLSAILCTLVWVLSCLVTGVEYFTCWSALYLYEEQCYQKYHAASIFLVTISLIFIPTMVLCSLIMFLKAQRNSQRSCPVRFYHTIVVTTVIFLIFALPGRIACLIGYRHPKVKSIWRVLEISFFLNIINSTLNPFVYFFIGRQKKLSVREPLSVAFQRSWDNVVQQHTDNKVEA